MKFRRASAFLLAFLLVASVALPATAGALSTQERAVQTQSAQQVQSVQDHCGFPVTKTDATGEEVTVEQQPETIVTLNPSAAQTLWEFGVQDKVVGISEYATYLDGAKDKEIVNTRSEGIIVEKIVALEPDLVIAPGTISNETVKNLRDKGLTVFAVSTPKSIDGVANKTSLLGRITGECTVAEETNDWMHQNVENVENAVADESSPRAMYVFYGYTVGNETFIHDMMTSAGTTNIMAQAGITGYAKVNKEVVRERNPQWIIVNTGDPGIPDDPAYNETIAVKQNQTVTVNINYMNQPAPRSVVYAVRNMTEKIHPSAYEEADYVPRSEFEITTTTTTTTTATTTTTETTEATTTTTTETTTPGFGMAGAAAALAGAALLARRR